MGVQLNILHFLLTEIAPGVKKCCPACFTRIMRKISQFTSGNNSPAEAGAGGGQRSSSSDNNDSNNWSEEETELMKNCLRAKGRNWQEVADMMGGGRTPDQCKKFFYAHRKKLSLDKLVLEYKKVSESWRGSIKDRCLPMQCFLLGCRPIRSEGISPRRCPPTKSRAPPLRPATRTPAP